MMVKQLKQAVFPVLLAVTAWAYIGCASMLMSEVVEGEGHTSKTCVLKDTIIAMGKPDQALEVALGKKDCVAFIGKKNTYMLYSGGKDLLQLSDMGLDGDLLTTDATTSKALNLKDGKVWGDLRLIYNAGKTISPDQHAALMKAGFRSYKSANKNAYRKSIRIAGLVYPSIKNSDQIPKLGKRQGIEFYATKHHPPSTLGQIVRSPLLLVGIAVDVALLPVYTIGFAALVIANPDVF
jgi:hypothetical protein